VNFININKKFMDISIVSISPISLALVPVVLGLVSLAKIYISSKWAPLLSLVLGIGAAFFIPSSTIALTILQGILIGLSASGLYSGARSTLEDTKLLSGIKAILGKSKK
jgi:hypothetical protein